ncbi:MAG: hypothetical protein FWD54_04885 [Endomicrobia bacterium]|nr:hypothetical protein [Endomicrobiia bacterium]MCL2799588.1 hypothetical protein [Endomicrobiia bacterium]
MTGIGFTTIKAHSLRVAVLFFMAASLGGCASGLNGRYYSKLRDKIDSGNFQAAADFVDSSKKKYGQRNILLFYLDSGFTNHLAENFQISFRSFENAKSAFDEFWQRSISAGAASMFFNDSTLPYSGKDFENTHMLVFAAMNHILSGDNMAAAVEARQANRLFIRFAVESNNRNFYKDDGFIRYFMGLVYENAGQLNDAHVSYFVALRAYRDGIVSIAPPQDLINDAYTTALRLRMSARAAQIKADFPSARDNRIPASQGELVILCYNGFIPRKISRVFEFALFDIWPYINQVEVDSESEAAEFNRARSVTVAALANDYVRVAFPQYQRIPNNIVSFSVEAGAKTETSYMAQDLAQLAERYLDDQITKIRAKALARAAVRYVLGRTTSKAVADQTGNATWGAVTRTAFNVFTALTETADTRAWNIIPENILMARLFLPEGKNEITLNFLDGNGNRIRFENAIVDIKRGKKNFMFVRVRS